MLSVRWLARATLVSSLAGLALCSQSQAAYTIGHAPARAGELCDYNATMLQTSSPGSAHLAPYDGVITSWSSRGFWATPVFKVVRPGSAGTYTVLGSDGPRVYTGDGTTLETYPVRFPVRQGDTIGAYVGTGYCATAPADYTYGLDRVNRSAGETGSFSGLGGSGRPPIAATLERDRDGDGFGDETQDECPTNGSTQGPCPLPTILGQTDFTPSGGASTAPVDFIATHSPDAKVTAPADGVVTSWSYAAGPSVNGTLKAKMFRHLGGGDYMAVGSSQAQVPSANALNTFPARIAVRQGDQIGVNTNGVPVASNFSSSDYTFARAEGDLSDGATATFGPGATRKINISAVLEADADSDGFGDTSQDQCPTDASTQAACPAAPPPATDDACKKARKKLAKAKAKLKKLKQKDAAARKLKTATKKVKKAKAAVRKAC